MSHLGGLCKRRLLRIAVAHISDSDLRVRQHILNTIPVLLVHAFRDLLLGEPGKVCDRFSWPYLTGHNVCLEEKHASLPEWMSCVGLAKLK
jgi:hypothetical protein